MNRSYYSSLISNFIKEDTNSILGQLTLNHSNRQLEDLQKNAWIQQIEILKVQLAGFEGQVYFEFSIPRMGKRVDNIVIINDVVFVIEFKVGSGNFDNSALIQVIDYTLDLKNFHEGSHNIKLIPILIATNSKEVNNDYDNIFDYKEPVKTNKENLCSVLEQCLRMSTGEINAKEWENAIYKPTPTIIEAAQALYKGHSVEEISRSDSGAINLSKTTDCINKIIEYAKNNHKKTICFVTGVPGAGKTLAGLNIASERMKADENEHAVFLSGNGPLVEVLREALARDLVTNSKKEKQPITKGKALRKTSVFIQNIHHFRDEYLKHDAEPTEKVVIFDEAQRAWNKKQVSSFMRRKKGIENFEMSEPEFLIDVMNRHEDWCTIICLVGGGQEINTGEAGIEEWVSAFENNYSDWVVYHSDLVSENKDYIKTETLKNWLLSNSHSEKELHLSTSVRSFRSENLSNFVQELLDLNTNKAKLLYKEIQYNFPIYMTRDLTVAKKWLQNHAKGSERIGLIASSGAKRLRPSGVNVSNEISAPNWFLNNEEDIRSSSFLEEVATEFDIQGLEIDWSCVAWGANFYLKDENWHYQNFKGSKWQNINQKITKEYLKNTYRVLLTRARQGMIIFLPEGSDTDHTRPNKFYNGTWRYFKKIGIHEI